MSVHSQGLYQILPEKITPRLNLYFEVMDYILLEEKGAGNFGPFSRPPAITFPGPGQQTISRYPCYREKAGKDILFFFLSPGEKPLKTCCPS